MLFLASEVISHRARRYPIFMNRGIPLLFSDKEKAKEVLSRFINIRLIIGKVNNFREIYG